MATHSSIPGCRIPWTEEPGGLQSTGLQRLRHNSANNTFTFTGLLPGRHWQAWVCRRLSGDDQNPETEGLGGQQPPSATPQEQNKGKRPPDSPAYLPFPTGFPQCPHVTRGQRARESGNMVLPGHYSKRMWLCGVCRRQHTN